MGKKGKSTGGAKQGSFSSAPIAKPAAANPTTATGSEGKKTESSVERRGKDKASSTQVISSAANSPALSPQDEAAAREIAFFRQSIDDLTTSLSSVSLKEVDLLSKFDAHLSGETSMPEEGIQAARDLYLDVAKFQMKLIAKYDVLKSCQVMLQHENAEMKRKASELVDETSKMLHQKDVLHALADELAKKKEVIQFADFVFTPRHSSVWLSLALQYFRYFLTKIKLRKKKSFSNDRRYRSRTWRE
jgi:hypothetical protein